MPEVVIAYISSAVPATPLPSDIVIDPSTTTFLSTNLKVVSALRLHKIATIHASSLVRYLGRMETAQFEIAADRLKALPSL